MLRFPVVRLLRMAALTAIAAGCLNVAYHDTAPAVVLAGLALYLVGLDAIEPLAQEIDQADRADVDPDGARRPPRPPPAGARRCCWSSTRSSAVRSAYAFNRTGTALGHHRRRLAAGAVGGRGRRGHQRGRRGAGARTVRHQPDAPARGGRHADHVPHRLARSWSASSAPCRCSAPAARSPAACPRWPGRPGQPWPSPSSSA